MTSDLRSTLWQTRHPARMEKIHCSCHSHQLISEPICDDTNSTLLIKMCLNQLTPKVIIYLLQDHRTEIVQKGVGPSKSGHPQNWMSCGFRLILWTYVHETLNCHMMYFATIYWCSSTVCNMGVYGCNMSVPVCMACTQPAMCCKIQPYLSNLWHYIFCDLTSFMVYDTHANVCFCHMYTLFVARLYEAR